MEKRKEIFVISQIGEEGSAERTRADEIAEHIIDGSITTELPGEFSFNM